LVYVIFSGYVVAKTGPAYFDRGALVVIMAYAFCMIARAGSALLLQNESDG